MISLDQPVLAAGSGLVAPFWLTCGSSRWRLVHAGRPNWLRYVARSLAAFGSLYASTIATVLPVPSFVGTLYALSRSDGP